MTLLIALSLLSTTTVFADETYFVPEGLGNMHTYTHWDKVSWKYDSKKTIDALGDNISDSYGIVRYGDTFAGAMTSTFGNVGDVVLVVNDGGIVYPVTIADEKSQKYCAWDHNPANMWGHYKGKCIVEFEVLSRWKWQSYQNGSGSYINDYLNRNIYKVINIGSVLTDTKCATNEYIHEKAKEHGLSGYTMLTDIVSGYTI